MKNHTNTNGIRIALFATFLLLCGLNLSAQYKLELGWQNEPGGLGAYISSIAKSDNDSLIYVAFASIVRTIRTSDGETVKIDTVDGTYNMFMSQDGKTLVASSGIGAGLLDPITFKRIYWDNASSSEYISLSFNEKVNKYIICGNTYNNPVNSLIRIYDVNTKSLIKEFGKDYFPPHTNILKKGWVTDDGKYIIYSMISNLPLTNKSYLKMIDLQGNVIKDFGEISSPNFTLTNDGKTLIYFMPDAVHFLDLETMKEKEGILSGGLNPVGIEMSSDGKFMMLGFAENSKITNSLLYCDLETKKYYYSRDFGSWYIFKLNKSNTSLFTPSSTKLYKFNFSPNSVIKDENSKLEFTIQVYGNELIINSQSEILPTYNFGISSIDGKFFKQLLPSDIQTSTNSAKINISILKSGTYLFQISNNSQILLSSKFNKTN